jgi:hypothetical protein
MPMSTYSTARSISYGAGTSLWVLFPPACVVALIILSNAPTWSSVAWAEYGVWVDLGTIAFLGTLWFFVITRIPARRQVRAAARQVPENLVAHSVRRAHDGFGWLAPFRDPDANWRGAPTSSVVVMVVTNEALQFWGRKGGLAPVGVLPWHVIERVDRPDHISLAIRLHVPGSGEEGLIGFKVASDRWLSRPFLHGSKLDQLVIQLDGLKTEAERQR